jgi:hypothetical protein
MRLTPSKKEPNYGRGRTGRTVTKTTTGINSAARITIIRKLTRTSCVWTIPLTPHLKISDQEKNPFSLRNAFCCVLVLYISFVFLSNTTM